MSKKTTLNFVILTLLLLSPLVILSNVSFASAASGIDWTHAFVGTNKDHAVSLIQSSDGGYVIAGYTNASNNGRQLWLLKTDANGGMEWNKTYGPIGSATGKCVVQTSDGGYALAGMVNYVGTLVKIDAAGNTQWNISFNEGYTWANHVIQTNDGSYVLSGSFKNNFGDSDTCWLAEVDSSGGSVWSKTYPQAGSGSASSVIQTSDGGYALVGTTENMDFLLVKTDAKGNFEWKNTYGSEDEDGGSSIIQSTDGSYVMAGMLWNRSAFSAGLGNGVGLVKADSNGNLLWLQNYPGSGPPSSMVRGSDGSYILCSGMLDKIDTNGNLLWSKNVSFNGDIGEGHAATTALVVATSDGGYAVAGTISLTSTTSSGTTSYVWIGKIDSEGDPAAFVPEFSPIAVLILAAMVCLVAVAFRKRLLQSKPASSHTLNGGGVGVSAFLPVINC